MAMVKKPTKVLFHVTCHCIAASVIYNALSEKIYLLKEIQKMKNIIFGTLLAASSTLAVAETPSFTFVEGGYSELKNSFLTREGIYINGGWNFAGGGFLRGKLSSVSETLDNSSNPEITSTLNLFSMGVGYAFKFDNGALYLVADVGDWEYDTEYDFGSYDYSRSGSLTDSVVEMGVGYKLAAGNILTMTTEINHMRVDWDDSETDTMTRGTVKAFFNVGIPVKFGVTYSRVDRLWEEYQLGARYEF